MSRCSLFFQINCNWRLHRSAYNKKAHTDTACNSFARKSRYFSFLQFIAMKQKQIDHLDCMIWILHLVELYNETMKSKPLYN